MAYVSTAEAMADAERIINESRMIREALQSARELEDGLDKTVWLRYRHRRRNPYESVETAGLD